MSKNFSRAYALITSPLWVPLTCVFWVLGNLFCLCAGAFILGMEHKVNK